MTKRAALLTVLGFAVAIASLAGVSVRERRDPRPMDVPRVVAAPRTELAPIVRPIAVEPSREAARTLEPLARPALEASPLRSLASTLRDGRVGPAEWSAQLSACADEAAGTDVGALASRATSAELDVVERLAALELLRALRAETAIVLSPEHARELADLAFESTSTRAWAAAAALATFGDAIARADLYEQLAHEDGGGNVALHGLRECARGDVLHEIGARLEQEPGQLVEERLAAAAQGIAHSIGQLTGGRASAEAQADQLLTLARKSGVTPTARRRLLLAVASLGSAEGGAVLCDIVCDAKTEPGFALEVADALRASPKPETATLLDSRLWSPQLEESRRARLTATRDFLLARDSRAQR